MFKLHTYLFWLVAAITLSVTPGASAQDSTPEPTATYTPPTETRLYAPLFLQFRINPATYTNPFDPDDIELLGIFESPTGRQAVVPGFWLQPYEDLCSAACTTEQLQPSGDPHWQVRFTPDEVGDWQYTLQARDNSAVIASEYGTFEVTPSDLPGFIRVAPNDRYFQYDNGLPYFVIGHNLNWSWEGGGGLEAYEGWLASLSQSGGNYARVIIDEPWFIGLEWDAAGDYTAAQDDAARLDRILEIAREHGVALQLVLLWHQSLSTYNGAPILIPEDPARPDASADWDDNPYNAAKGGPLGGAGLFYSDETAQALFRRRLRYIVARWGYSPQVFAWEIVDELDRAGNADPALKDTWLQEMASYVRQIDPQRHLITAGSYEYRESLVLNPLLDFTQVRFYQSLPIEATAEQEAAAIDLIRRTLRLSTVPTLLSGYSLNQWFEPTENDPEGIHFQNTLWAAALSGSGGGGVSAWGETYVIPQGLERYYAALAAFTSGIDWAALNFEPAEAGLLSDDETGYGFVRVDAYNRRFRDVATDLPTLIISPDGVFPAVDQVPSYLYGTLYNTQLRREQTYSVAPPVDTHLEIGIRAVSDQSFARLTILIDGVAASEVMFQKDTQGGSVRVPLSAGEHTIILSNTGEDWLELDYLEVGHLIAPARVLTLRDSAAGIALAWLQHRDYTWDTIAAGEQPAPLQFTYRLDGMRPGRYLAELWDPLTGAVLGEEMLRVGEDGVLRFELLPLTRQLAIRAFRQPDTASTTSTLPESEIPVTVEPPADLTPLPSSDLIDQLRDAVAEATEASTAAP